MNFDDFSYEENGRRYIKPQINLDESNRFIDNLRGIQQTNNDQIRQDTYNLGTAVPSNLGGLVGGGSYFKSRFQTPQTNSLVADLRATAQATALQEAMNNELSKAKKRYSDAYRAAQKRADKASNNNNGNSLQDILNKLNVKTKDNGASDILKTEEINWEDFWKNPDSDLLSDVSVEELEEQLGYKRQALKGYTDAFDDSMQSYKDSWLGIVGPAWNKGTLKEMHDNAEKYAQQIQLLQNELARR